MQRQTNRLPSAATLLVAALVGSALFSVTGTCREEFGVKEFGVYHWILYGDGSTLVDVGCHRRG